MTRQTRHGLAASVCAIARHKAGAAAFPRDRRREARAATAVR